MSVSLSLQQNVQETVPLLYVTDIEQSCRFYCDGLGFEMAAQWQPDGKLAWCRLQLGGAALMLQQDSEEDPPPDTRGKGVTFYFICADADAVYREITARGINATTPRVEFYGMNQTFVTDPDGYELCFENPVEPA